MGTVNSCVLGLVAGRGQFPQLVAEEARKQGRRVAAVGFSGHTDPAIASSVDHFAMLKLGQLGKLIRFFHSHAAAQLTFAGAISKPKAVQLRPDFRAVRLLLSLPGKGDDALFRALFALLEREGFQIVQAADFVPALRGPAGVLSRRWPTDEEWADLRQGWRIAKAIGALDIGQCVVVKRGIVAAVEGPEGTDAAIRRGGELAGPGCVVVKTLKPGQDERVDLPAMGADTVQTLLDARGSCLGYEAGKTLFFNLSETLQLADAAGAAVVGLSEKELAG